jgi:hypothetical protein
VDPELVVDLNDSGEIVLSCSCGWHATTAELPASEWDDHFHAAHPAA